MTATFGHRAYFVAMDWRPLLTCSMFVFGGICLLYAMYSGFPANSHNENIWQVLKEVNSYRQTAFFVSIGIPILYLFMLAMSGMEGHILGPKQEHFLAKLPFNATVLAPFVGAFIISMFNVPYVSPEWYKENTIIETSANMYRVFEDGTIVAGGHASILASSMSPSSDVVYRKNGHEFTKRVQVNNGEGVAIYHYAYSVHVPDSDAIRQFISANFDQFSIRSGHSAGTLLGLIADRGPDLSDLIETVHRDVVDGNGNQATMLARFDLLARPRIEQAFASVNGAVTITTIDLIETRSE